MSYTDTTAQVRFDMSRTSDFAYTCNGCARCCRNKITRLSPYDVLRLARHIGLSTSLFIARHTEAGGTVLRTDNFGACQFLRDSTCGVYADRPLACRLYPLARAVDWAGRERFGHLAAHPLTEGTYGTKGSVQFYLRSQAAEPFLEAADRYAELYRRMVAVLARLDPAERERRHARRGTVAAIQQGAVASSWIDVDRTILAFCRTTGRAPPQGLDATVAMHIEAVETWLTTLGGRAPPA